MPRYGSLPYLKVDIWGRSFFVNFYISSLANSPNYIVKGDRSIDYTVNAPVPLITLLFISHHPYSPFGTRQSQTTYSDLE